MHYVYVLKSERNGRRYIGYTQKSPQERLNEHNSGKSEYTKRNGPFVLIRVEEFQEEGEARRREKFLKTGHGRRVLDSSITK